MFSSRISLSQLLKRRWLIYSLLLLSLSSFAGITPNKIKAVFIYKFMQYTEFPQGKSGLKIGVMGNSDIIAEMESIWKAKEIQHVSFSLINNPQEVDQYDIIFIPENQSQHLDLVLNAAKKQGVLIIADKKELAEKGAGISFYEENGKLKFMINKNTIDSKKLKISSSLMALGTVI